MAIAVQDIWLDFLDVNNQNTHLTGYPTEKNIDMLKRIINSSSNPGDIVLDCFAGSGTTLVAAEELGRQWIGVDIGEEAIKIIQNRFENGTKPLGDYVSQRKKKDEASQSLFDNLEPDNGCSTLDNNITKCNIQYQIFEEL